MSSIDQLPPERDLPGDRHARLRTRVLTAIAEPATRRHTAGRPLSVRIAAAGVAMAACAALGWVGFGGAFRGGPAAAYALGDGVLSPETRHHGRLCLEEARRDDSHGNPMATWPEDQPPRLLNFSEQPGREALLIYQVQSRLLYCKFGPAFKSGPEPVEYNDSGYTSGGIGILEATPWLPGPISVEAASSSDLEGGYVTAAGRVSGRVARVVLDDGAGHRSTARLVGGTFTAISDGRLKTLAGELISYDAAGTEIDRRPVPGRAMDRCYTDPAGNHVNPISDGYLDVAFESLGGRCEPAERWTRRNSSAPTGQ